MFNEHLRPLLDNPRDMHLFFRVAELLATGDVPDCVASILTRRRMTALQKPRGGVRGIVGRRRCSAPCRQDDRPAIRKSRGGGHSPFPARTRHKEQVASALPMLCKP